MREHGRIIEIREKSIVLRNFSGLRECEIDPLSFSRGPFKLGDLVQVQGKQVLLLTPNQHPQRTMKWMEETLHPRRLHATKIRFKIEKKIRDFFSSQDFIETRTPLLAPCPGMETHIRPFQIQHMSLEDPGSLAKIPLSFLPTSPEFAMKRLLVGGLEKIFQISPAFRDEPYSMTHRPEFTLLEWYRILAKDEDIMEDTETLFEQLALHLFGKTSFVFQGQEISVQTPWPRLRVRDLFLQHAAVDLSLCRDLNSLARECERLGLGLAREQVTSPVTWDDLYFKIWLNCIEPKLPANQAVFVTRYPASQAALARVDADPDGTLWARRFEAYAGGIELGNAFEELTDPFEQRRRFEEDMQLREKIYGGVFPKTPLDEGFLEALQEGMPPAGGMALGLDRLVMLFADEPNINYTFFL